MKRIGLLAVAEPSNGGTFQYTMSMLEALRVLENYEINIYTDIQNSYYNESGFKINSIKVSKRQWPWLLIKSVFGLSNDDPFIGVDFVLAPIYSPILLHTKKPFAFTLHDLQEYYFPDNFSILERTWRKIINRQLVKKAISIICESEFVKKDIIRFLQVPECKIRVITAPPLSLKRVPYSTKELENLRMKYNLHREYLFYPAQFWPHKNHIRLVDAFAKISVKYPHINLVFTGQKRYDYKRIFEKINALGLAARVNHLGYVGQEDLGGIYQGALALVMPSLFESVSIPIYEAFQYEVPVCCSNVVALPEQVGEAAALFDPTSIESISATLDSILGSDDFRNRISQLGRLQLSKVTPSIYARKLSDLVEEL